MRTKALLLTAAVIAAGIGTSVAQTVFSANAVGYVNVALGAGYSILANPLNGTNNNLNTILPAVADGTFVLKWDNAVQNFAAPSQFIEGVGWIPDNTLSPGEGAFINVPTAATLTFIGEVPQGNLSVTFGANYSLISQMTPQTNGLSTVGFPAADGDFVLFWDNGTQNFKAPIQFVEGVGWLPSDPSPALGEGFFLNTASGRSWNRTFSVNN
jgi:hypothetical protein